MTANGLRTWEIDEKPHGKPWDEWINKWWNWLVSIPLKDNPANDDTGMFCDRNQNGPVWNLAGPITGALADKGYRLGLDTVRRECEIPEERSILALLAGGEVTKLEYPHIPEAQLLTEYIKGNYVSHLNATVSGTQLTREYFDDKKYLVSTRGFPLRYGKDNIFGVADGQEAEAASLGYWLFIKPGTPKEFTLEIQTTTEKDPFIKSEKFSYHVTYKIKRK
jgi:hypothetical protein